MSRRSRSVTFDLGDKLDDIMADNTIDAGPKNVSQPKAEKGSVQRRNSAQEPDKVKTTKPKKGEQEIAPIPKKAPSKIDFSKFGGTRSTKITVSVRVPFFDRELVSAAREAASEINAPDSVMLKKISNVAVDVLREKLKSASEVEKFGLYDAMRSRPLASFATSIRLDSDELDRLHKVINPNRAFSNTQVLQHALAHIIETIEI